MRNEISPRRAADRKAPGRGVQQAGRIGRAKDERGRSFSGLQRDCYQFGKTLERDTIDTTTPSCTNHAHPIVRGYRTTPTHGFRRLVGHTNISGESRC